MLEVWALQFATKSVVSHYRNLYETRIQLEPEDQVLLIDILFSRHKSIGLYPKGFKARIRVKSAGSGLGGSGYAPKASISSGSDGVFADHRAALPTEIFDRLTLDTAGSLFSRRDIYCGLGKGAILVAERKRILR